MTVDFQEHFWGEKQNGFDVLYQNLKCGSASSKELSEFVKSRSVIEQYNLDLLLKLSRRTNQHLGTFQPLWLLLKSSTEKLSSLHMQTLQRFNMLVKDINKYCEEHHKKQKQIKSDELPTIDSITDLKEIIQQLNKSKEFYTQKALEQDRLRKDNASQKDIEKAEARTLKACNEYKIMIDKYRKFKDDYESKFRVSCQNFQKIENDHLVQMKEFLFTYSQILDSGHALIGQILKDFNHQCNEMTVDKLLQKFIETRGTGSILLADIQFEEANLNTISLNNLASSTLSTSSGTPSQNFATPSLTGSVSNSGGNSRGPSYDLINFGPSPVPPATPPINAPTNNPLSGDSSSLFGSNFDFPQHSATLRGFPATGTMNKLSNEDSMGSVESAASASSHHSSNTPTNSVSTNQPQTLTNNNPTGNNHNNNNSHHRSFPDIRSKWFNRSRKNNKIGSKSSKKSESDNGSVKNDEPMVDAEGYTIRPQEPIGADKDKDDDSFSDSDSGDDSEGDGQKKIFVKINPLNNGQEKISASVDQLIASAGALTLAPPSSSRRNNHSTNPSPVAHLNDQTFKRSVSATTTSAFSPANNDLSDLFSSAPAPTSGFANFKSASALSSTTAPSRKDELMKSQDRYAALIDIFKADNKVIEESPAKDDSKQPENDDKSSIPPPPPTSEPPKEEEFNFVPPLPPKNSDATLSFSSAFTGGGNGTLSKSFSSSTVMGSQSSLPFGGQPMFQKNQTLSKSFVGSFSNGTLSRTDSISSLSSDFRMTPISFSSRDVSPLTVGALDMIPIAVSFQESIGGSFKGSDETLCKINVIGCIKLAFSASIVQTFAQNTSLPVLEFCLKNTDRIDRIILSKELVNQVDAGENWNRYQINMATLQQNISKMASQSPNARYYNMDIFKYQLKPKPGAGNAPLQIVNFWKCEAETTNLFVNFKYNAEAFGPFPQALKNVQITANLDGNVTGMNSMPEGRWDPMTKQTIWRFAEISSVAPNGTGVGTIKAKFDITNGPTTPCSIYAAFNNQDATISGLDFELLSQSGYKLSLVKKQFASGRYYCEPKM